MPAGTGIDGNYWELIVGCIDGERLRELRRARGWDPPEMARRLHRAAGDDYVPPHDSLVRMVRRWERKGLNLATAERYELIYARALGISPQEVQGDGGALWVRDSSGRLPGTRRGRETGTGQRGEPSPAGLGCDECELWPDAIPVKENPPRAPRKADSRKLAAANGDSEGSRMAGLWTSETFAAGREFDITPDDEERIILASRRPARIDTTVVSSLSNLLAAQRYADDTMGSGLIIKPVMAQLRSVESLVIDARGELRPKLIDVAAQWAQFAGWLHANTGRNDEARALFDRSIGWSAEVGNLRLVAHSLCFKGHVDFNLGMIAPMVGIAQAAQQYKSAWVGERAFDANLEARGLAMMGNQKDAIRKVEEARELAHQAVGQASDRPPWNYYCSMAFYELVRGLVYRYLGRDNSASNVESIETFNSALAEIGEARSSEWAAYYISHLAIAYIQAGSPDKAREAAFEVLRITRATESVKLANSLHGIYAALTRRWPGDPGVTELREALNS